MIEYKVRVDGSCQTWYLNGKYHREDGPAYIDGDYQVWFLNGKCHREDGPAYIDGDRQVWFLYGNQLSEEEVNNLKTKEMTLAEIIEELGYNIKVVK